MDPLITDCTLTSNGCTAGVDIAFAFDDTTPCLLRLVGSSAACGHCGEVVYPDVVVIRDHTIRCEQEVTVWHSRGLGVEVHRCDRPAAEATSEELLTLVAIPLSHPA